MEKKILIIEAERKFAREVTLGAIVANPPSGWYYLIPGMFIIDFLRRESALRRYTKHFLFPRNLAIDAALALINGEEETSVASHVEAELAARLSSLSLNTEDLFKAHMNFMNTLITHYQALLRAEGDSYHLLIREAYQNRDDLQSVLSELTAAERAVDQLVIEKSGGNEKVEKKIHIEQQQIENRREILLDAVFS
jgi:hypothetical protein